MYEVSLVFSLFSFIFVLIIFSQSKLLSAFHPITYYLLFHGFIFVFRPIVVFFGEYDFIYRIFRFQPSISDKITVICASNIGFLVFVYACWRAGNIPMKFKFDRLADGERKRLRPLFIWVAAICVPIGAYSLALTWNSAVTTGSAYSGMVIDATSGHAINTENTGYVVEAQLMLATCGALIAWLLRFRLLAVLPLVLFVVFRAGIGGRGPFITALGSVGLLYLYEHRLRFPNLRILFALPIIVLFFNLVGDDRGASIRRLVANDVSSTTFGANRDRERFLEGMDFANMEYFEYLVYVIPQRSGTYGYFNDVLQVFTEPVPRAIWPDKPAGAPFSRIKFFEYGNPVTMSFSLPGEGWYSLGWIGVIIWSGFCGWALGWIYRRFVNGAQSAFQTAAYMVFIPTLTLAFRDGQLVTVFRQALFFLMPVFVWWCFARLIGVPKLAKVRMLNARRLRDLKDDKLPRTLKSNDRNLPSAVARRRLALARTKLEQQS